MAKSVRRCDHCLFWELKSKAEVQGDSRTGRCHRHAPAPVAGRFHYEVLEWLYNERDIERDPGCTEDAVTIWPVTTADEWCGEFRSK